VKVTSLTIRAAEIPFTCAFGTPFSTRTKLAALAIFLGTDEGPRGESLLIAIHGRRLRVLEEMVRSLEPLVIGCDPAQRAAFIKRAKTDAAHIGHAGVAAIGIGALDGALLDLAAKAMGLPVHRFLGAQRSRVRTYYSGGFWPHVPLDEILRTAERAIAHGHRAVKLRIGSLPLDEDVVRLKALRDSVGPHIRIMTDAGRRLDADAAIRLGNALAPYDLAWIEEPVDAEDYDAEAKVAAALKTPIALGESVFSTGGFERILRLRSAGVLMPDLQRIGGPLPFLEIGKMAAAHNIDLSSHLAPEMSLPLLAHVPNAGFLEIMPWASPFYRDAVVIEDGHAVMPETPGWGFALCERMLAQHAIA
jgi:L-alanine-DL-glutamate epimerase-like enolase superfamily enzyme